MKNILLIIDPQNDFIDGSLAVVEAEAKMKNLAEYLKEYGNTYDKIYVTMDCHPADHCSFIENGGLWPAHCVEDTDGAFVPDYLLSSLVIHKDTEIFYKGCDKNKEEYSIFSSEEDGLELEVAISSLIKEDSVYIDVCGIAGDYCVLETLKGLRGIIGNDYISVLSDFTASIDGGEKLNKFLKDNNINNVEYVY